MPWTVSETELAAFLADKISHAEEVGHGGVRAVAKEIYLMVSIVSG